MQNGFNLYELELIVKKKRKMRITQINYIFEKAHSEYILHFPKCKLIL